MKKTIAIILSILMVVSMVQITYAAESDGTMTTLDISAGRIVITPDSVTLNGENVAVDPDGYIITGTNNGNDSALQFKNLSESAATINVVFKDLTIVAGSWCSALTIDNSAPLTLNIRCEGTNAITSYNHPVFSGYGREDSPIVIHITHTEGSTFHMERKESAREGIAFSGYAENQFIMTIDGKQIGADLHVHQNADGVSTCKGYLCTVCERYFGEKNEAKHVSDGKQTCKGYYCTFCEKWYGDVTNHDLSTEQTCKGYQCGTCEQFFGEAAANNHRWDYGRCSICYSKYPSDAECVHAWDDKGECTVCGKECNHPAFDDEKKCTVCAYHYYPFSVTTGGTVTYHETFKDALDKASDGSVITLLKDYVDYEDLEINKAITLDLNGKEWEQPSLGSFVINANATFTDSVGGSYLAYGLKLNSPVTLQGGSYRYIMIEHNTDDMLDDYLDKCCSFYSYWKGDLLDLSSVKQSEGAITIKTNHQGGTATCTQRAVCTKCFKEYGGLLDHNYGTEWKNDKVNHWHECQCGDKKDVAKHTEKIINKVAATSTKKGYTGDTVCAVCGVQIAKGTETVWNQESGSAKTGDSSRILLWTCLFVVSGVYLLGTDSRSKRKFLSNILKEKEL